VKANEREQALKNAEEPGKGNGEERVKDYGRDRLPENEQESKKERGPAHATAPERAIEQESE
jgi:hypothetical protein